MGTDPEKYCVENGQMWGQILKIFHPNVWLVVVSYTYQQLITCGMSGLKSASQLCRMYFCAPCFITSFSPSSSNCRWYKGCHSSSAKPKEVINKLIFLRPSLVYDVVDIGWTFVINYKLPLKTVLLMKAKTSVERP